MKALAKLPRTREIAQELLLRSGAGDDVRKNALADLAKFDGVGEPQAIVAALTLAGERSDRNESVVHDLVRLLVSREPKEFAGVRGDMEAMALRRPVVTTFVAGIPELIKHGEHGWLVPAGDLEGLAAAMEECLATAPEAITRP